MCHSQPFATGYARSRQGQCCGKGPTLQILRAVGTIRPAVPGRRKSYQNLIYLVRVLSSEGYQNHANNISRFDAFTHKPTAQYSLAYEKASIIFNISAVLSCHAAHQNRSEDSGLKTAYHSFQASAGMFTYINENFLHAPSTDLSRDTVKTLIQIMLAQGQEVFLEKQIADGKKVGLLAKLASQAGYLYSGALDGTQDNVNKAIFEKVWLLVVQVGAPDPICPVYGTRLGHLDGPMVDQY